ncbi:helix-turn-helix domain-containing protein [Macrococcus bovicus]|uniref:helix-turn-helix domain-containing protein n=1 Tax=Macrococcus bovicus TaxID=69968 RepID=UPI0025A58E8E|nr:helix-turn-helix domain-containing protein [Macrococcus bovicus]WJP96755.1 helix-turn-helix domain-containing protein [Macrococcus bovicus]
MDKLGENIKRRRIELNMTQKDLANGICTQSQISKIEKNEIIPLSNLLISIAERLQISVDNLVNHIYDHERVEIHFPKSVFDKLLLSRDYDAIESLAKNLIFEKLKYEEQIYVKWLLLIVSNVNKQEYIIDELQNLYTENQHISNDLKMNILNSIAIQYRVNNDYKKSKEYFEKALSHNNENVDKKLLIKILYNMSNVLFYMEDWTNLLELVQDAINYVYQNNIYEIYPELVYSKYYSMKKLSINFSNKEELIIARFIAKKQIKFEVIKILDEI